MVRRRIQASLQYPESARRRSIGGSVQVEIIVEPNGAVSHVAVVASSRHGVLDRAAMETVRALAPVPFPAGVTPRTLRFHLPIRFDLEQ
ncbi:MAG: energy transducer TonB [Candidatus Rokuibacteriota bacterium]